jgi:hypothetical protein
MHYTLSYDIYYNTNNEILHHFVMMRLPSIYTIKSYIVATIIFLLLLVRYDNSFCSSFQFPLQIQTQQVREHSGQSTANLVRIYFAHTTSNIYSQKQHILQSLFRRIFNNKNQRNVLYSESLIMINGSKNIRPKISFFEGIDVAALPESEETFMNMTVETESPPMSFDKFVTMQEKRAVVTIRYSGDAGLKPYFLTIAKKLKASHPDILIERRILPAAVDGNDATFEVLVEGKVVIGKSRSRKLSRNGLAHDVHDVIGRRSVYVSMSELGIAISRARRKHRPTTTVYGGDDAVGTNMLPMNRRSTGSKNSNMKNTESAAGKTDWLD